MEGLAASPPDQVQLQPIRLSGCGNVCTHPPNCFPVLDNLGFCAAQSL
jgi:hypothetical protein